MRRTRNFLIVLMIVMTVAPGLAGESDPEATVRRLVTAFNAKDVDQMLEVCSPSVRWMSVAGDEIVVEADGAEALREGMERYFTAIPSARSELRKSMVSGSFVATVEEARWESDGKPMVQCGAAFYELQDGKITNVWYFQPSHACPEREASGETELED